MADTKYIYPDGVRWVVRCKDFDVGAKIFGYSKYGNKELALKAAVAYRDEQIAKHHTIVLLEPSKPPQPPAPKQPVPKPAKEVEPTPDEISARWSKFRSLDYGPDYVKRLDPSVQASIRHSNEGLQMGGDECAAYHYTGAWDAAFTKSQPGHSTWRPPIWDNNRETILTRWVNEQLLKLKERNLPFTQPWINSWMAKQNLIE
jgi:hypothetical protein